MYGFDWTRAYDSSTMTSWKLGQRLLEKCVFLWLSHPFLSLFLSVFLSSSNRVGLSIVKMKRLSFPFEPLYTFSLSLSILSPSI